MNIRFTEAAEAEAEACDTWWRGNRDARELFALELRDTKALLVSSPKLGMVYTIMDGKQVRKVLMPKTRHHVYYVFDSDANEIVVHAVWGALKGRGPQL